MDVKGIVKKNWWILALLFILVFSYYIRSVNIVPNRILSYDPVFQYRFTKYFADWGHLPVWDELTYYVGRAVTPAYVGPFMQYVTAFVYWMVKAQGVTLFTVASYMSAFYGMLIAIPAFLLAREVSNKYGGLLAAVLVATSPQILIRTFGSSYDTDQLVLFFILFTMYLGMYALRKKTVASTCLAIGGFTAFMLTWGDFTYTLFILFAAVAMQALLGMFLIRDEAGKIRYKMGMSDRLRHALPGFKKDLLVLAAIIAAVIAIGFLNNFDVIGATMAFIGFAQKAEAWIVNISIAELQPFNVFDAGGWTLAMGRFGIGEASVDNLIFLAFISLLFISLYASVKKGNFRNAGFLLALFLVSFYTTTRGIRFTEFTSAMFLIMISAGYGCLAEWSFKRDHIYRAFSIGLGLCIAVMALGIGAQTAYGLGPDINSNWESAWNFLKTQTPELSLVGTWWDPGHMITGLAERRVIGDGAHCGNDCLYTINDRITDLGKIMATTDENVSMQLIRKYQGTSPNVYWIASDDLMGKYQWLQYFGMGCDSRTDQNCQLYNIFNNAGKVSYAKDGSVFASYFNPVVIINGNIPVPIYVQGKSAAMFSEVIYYDTTGKPASFRFSDYNTTSFTEQLKPYETAMGVKFVDKTIPLTIWIPMHNSYVVSIPPSLRETIFTKMFFLEGQGLEHFKQVFRNEQVKIYEVV